MSFTDDSFSRAILHIDGDAFFASCETALDPSLRGKPVVTGRERGIASSMSYEAKAKGVTRGMTIRQIQAVCPEAVILPSNYEMYSIFSERMYRIVRRYTDVVDEYSIDECFADLTGCDRYFKKSYREVAGDIKRDLDHELGMTFSLGVAPNKVLAKVGSKWKKPSGLTVIAPACIDEYLKDLPTSKLWGIGSATSRKLALWGIYTSLQYKKRSEDWVKRHMYKSYMEMWRELNGEYVYELDTEGKTVYKSISKTKTFTPPSSDMDYLLSQLSKNIENACIKARRYDLYPSNISFFLKTQDFDYHWFESKLENPSNAPSEVLSLVRKHFHMCYKSGVMYRATGVVLGNLAGAMDVQKDLFGVVDRSDKWQGVHKAVDGIDKKYGKHTVFLGSSFQALRGNQYEGARSDKPQRSESLFNGENSRQRVGIPMLGDVT